ncbi:aldo/keto reductase [Deinococcus cellulosilyticus]|uniref:Aldo/keto reductase n=1 Tax=Deinococcus cellulosilyticus (strain DSM 18568 / NBRC 106333 / KACC 11606 / 5516J-15) TaxID=1223518 RepID=A0A511N3F5_DEIC1|nr:aldo/keto reductase [Deinococcus cellulosilyticus]GEM46946.1 aldo/keto reductase [Deinococcus cellulosilyticus NBRC 106333 = KACC 11606]
MQYLRLGKSGLNVSRICLGTMTYGDPGWRDWVLPEEQSRPFIQKALEAGINFFDTADMYSLGRSEEVVGRALKDFARREDVVIATKVYWPMGEGVNNRGLSRKHIMDAVHASLKRLGTDHIDLYQIHRYDANTPLEETLEALHDLVKLGMVRYIGASSMFAYQFARSLYLADLKSWTRFVSMQNHYNLVYREEEREMIPLCIEEGVGVIPWSPLARGFLTGNRKGGEAQTTRAKSDGFSHSLYGSETDHQIADRVAEVAGQHGVSSSQVAIAWMLSKPGITAPIIGASKLPHLEQAIAALDVKLSEEDVRHLEEPYCPRSVAGI